jgi:hypothetical protein
MVTFDFLILNFDCSPGLRILKLVQLDRSPSKGCQNIVCHKVNHWGMVKPEFLINFKSHVSRINLFSFCCLHKEGDHSPCESESISGSRSQKERGSRHYSCTRCFRSRSGNSPVPKQNSISRLNWYSFLRYF